MADLTTIITKLHEIPSKDFTQEKVLGQGEVGKVYSGPWNSVSIAVKKLFMQIISETFRREAKMMISCPHPNIVQLYGVCLEEDKLALLMECLDNGSLYSLLQNTTINLSWPGRIKIATDTASGLSYLHNLQIVHSNLKSLSVFLAKDGTAKIVDFGLDKIRPENTSKMTTGQPSDSPQQFNQKAPASFLTNIYSLGMIFWEIASRSIPCSDPSNKDIVAKLIIPSDTPSLYALLIKKCWKSPQERPTANMLAKELTQLQIEQPLFPKPVVMSPSLKPSLPSIAFGKEQWAKYFGDIGVEPPLPSDIDTILASPCPFWRDKTVQETHLLVLVPQTVNDKPLTLQYLGELIRKPLNGGKYANYRGYYNGKYKDIPTPNSHWALVTRDVIKGSPSIGYSSQQALIHNTKHYEVPNILDLTVSIFMEHVRTGTRLYSDKSSMYTTCQEKYDNNHQLVVGGFFETGIGIGSGQYSGADVGVSGLRKL